MSIYYDYIVGCLKICFLFLGISCFMLVSFYFSVKIDENRLSDLRYCPSCGIDLINK